MNEPTWVLKQVVLALHSEQLAEHGGSDGIRDENLLDSALARPVNVFAYNNAADIFDLAAAYAFGIARNHAFIDGNKRTAASVSMTFLRLNGWEVEAPKEEEYSTFLGVAEGSLEQSVLAAWFRAHAAAI